MAKFLLKIWDNIQNGLGSLINNDGNGHWQTYRKDVYSKRLLSIKVDEPPENVQNDTVYIVGENGFYWMIALSCPCGCNEIIHLNLLKDASPRWRFRLKKKSIISISPSIWRRDGCRSHFIIRKGQVIWVTF